jgi:hypothetical protein
MDKVNFQPGDRNPAVAGKFYPDSKEELLQEIIDLQQNAAKYPSIKITPDEKLLALLVPHAGYVFSGTVAASAFSMLENIRQPCKRVFLIGSGHNTWFEGASVYPGNSYITPLGKVKVDKELAEELIETNKEIRYFSEAHKHEHSLEVQLPFLQWFLKSDFKILPLLLGGQTTNLPERIADILRPWFSPENLFVISTDLSHYPSYNEAMCIDKLTVNAYCRNNPAEFLEHLRQHEKRQRSNLSTCMCGSTAALTLLNLTAGQSDIEYRPILYQNSGDIPVYGDKNRVVGYQSIAIIRKSQVTPKTIMLGTAEKNLLLNIAETAIRNVHKLKKPFQDSVENIPESLMQPGGVFVSVYIKSELRGCIGSLESEQPLSQTVYDLAISASTKDMRFKRIEEHELNNLRIEISVLTPMKRITGPDEIIPGRHGILIRKDSRSGTFLPQVGRRTGWTAVQMLEECSVRKAGLGRKGWQKAELFTYEALIFDSSEKTI